MQDFIGHKNTNKKDYINKNVNDSNKNINKNINSNKNHNNINKINLTNKNIANKTNKKSYVNKNVLAKIYTKYFHNDEIRYEFTQKEFIWNVIKNCLWMGMVSILFYRSLIAFFCLMPLQLPMLERQREMAYRKQKKEISKEFRETIMSVSANLQAGYSVENAFCEAYYDVAMLFGVDSYMARELVRLRGKLQNNQPMEIILQELAERTKVEDIKEFADIFAIAKRSGGDMRGIIANTARIIGDKIEVSKEIDTVMAEKLLEQKMMRFIPFAMIAYISITSSGYFDSLYHGVFGVLIMTACLGLYGVACMISDRIMQIEV